MEVFPLPEWASLSLCLSLSVSLSLSLSLSLAPFLVHESSRLWACRRHAARRWPDIRATRPGGKLAVSTFRTARHMTHEVAVSRLNV